MNFSFSVQQNVGCGTSWWTPATSGSLGRHLLAQRDLNWIPFGANFLPENKPILPIASGASAAVVPAPLRRVTPTSRASNTTPRPTTTPCRSPPTGASPAACSWAPPGPGRRRWITGRAPRRLRERVSSQLPGSWFYCLADIDRTHMVKLNWVWDVPKIPVRGKALDARAERLADLRHRHVSSAARPSGVGWSTTSAVDITGTPSDSARIVVTGNPVLPKGDRTFEQNFRTDVFRVPAVGTIGNSARNVLRQPGTNNWDIAVIEEHPGPRTRPHSAALRALQRLQPYPVLVLRHQCPLRRTGQPGEQQLRRLHRRLLRASDAAGGASYVLTGSEAQRGLANTRDVA